MQTAYKYRIYPNRSQRELIERTFGCCRWVYNRCNALRMDALEARRKVPRGAREPRRGLPPETPAESLGKLPASSRTWQ